MIVRKTQKHEHLEEAWPHTQHWLLLLKDVSAIVYSAK